MGVETFWKMGDMENFAVGVQGSIGLNVIGFHDSPHAIESLVLYIILK